MCENKFIGGMTLKSRTQKFNIEKGALIIVLIAISEAVVAKDECGNIQAYFNHEVEGVNNPELSLAIEKHLDKTLTIYLTNKNETRVSVFKEVGCYLLISLMRCKDYKSLKDELNQILSVINIIK